MTGRVRTVLGDIPAAALGRTDYHEHLFQATPLLPGEELDDEQRSGEEAGIGYWSISRFERDVLEAVSAAHRETGAPVMVHGQPRSAARLAHQHPQLRGPARSCASPTSTGSMEL